MAAHDIADGFPPNLLSKPGYRLEFNDDFLAPQLDTSKWLPYYLPQWSSRQFAAARYSVSGGALRLHIVADQKPWCPEYNHGIRVSSVQTGCFAGPVGSSIGQHRFKPQIVVREEQPLVRNYTPRYGYFETRLKAVPIPGYMVALWMIGFESSPEQSAEICICEIFGSEASASDVRIGYGLRPFGDNSIREEFYKDMVQIDVSKYHIYAAEWTPSQTKFFIDNRSTRIANQSPQYPMQLMLGIYEIPGQLNSESLPGSWPKTFEVDYVRCYTKL